MSKERLQFPLIRVIHTPIHQIDMHLAILAIAFVLGTCASVDASPALIQPTHLVRVGDSSFRCQCDPTLTGSNVTAFRDCQRGTFTDKTIFTSGACQTFAESCSCQEISKLVRRVVNCDGVLVVPESRDQATATKQEEFMRESGFTADEETGKFPVDAELALSHYLDMHPSIDAFMLERGIVLEPKVSYPPEAEALFLEHSTILSDIGITANKDVFMANAGYLKSRAEVGRTWKAVTRR